MHARQQQPYSAQQQTQSSPAEALARRPHCSAHSLSSTGQQAARGPRQRGTGRGTLAGGGCGTSSCNRCNPRQHNPWVPSGCPRHVPARPRSSTAPKASERIVAGVGGRLRRLLSWRRLLCGRRLRGAPPGRRAVCLPRRRRLEGLLSAIRWRRCAMVWWRMLVLVVLYTGTPAASAAVITSKV